MQLTQTGTSRCAIVAETGAYHTNGKYNDTFYYPISLPGDAARLKITRADTVVKVANINFCSMSTPVQNSSGNYVAQMVDRVVNSDIAYTNNVAIVSIPQHEGYAAIDSVLVQLQTDDNSQFLEAYLNKITIEALPAA